jgi:hypothetical protein
MSHQGPIRLHSKVLANNGYSLESVSSLYSLTRIIADSILCSIEAQNAFHLNYSTSSFRYPCLVTTYSLSPSLPWAAKGGLRVLPAPLS